MKDMTKEELVQVICEMEEVLAWMEEKITVQKKVQTGRKEQVLEILKEGPIFVQGIADRLGISARNVSSQLTYLRRDGYEIATTSVGKKFLV